MDMEITESGAIEIARRSRGTPRIANALLRRVRDFAQIKGDGTIDVEIAKFALKALNVDEYGLDEMDNKILTTIIDKFKGGPVGITTLATAVSESAETIESRYQDYQKEQADRARQIETLTGMIAGEKEDLIHYLDTLKHLIGKQLKTLYAQLLWQGVLNGFYKAMISTNSRWF